MALIGVATILLGGCSETGSFGNTFGTPFSSTAPRLDQTPTGTVASSYAAPQSQVSNFFADAFKPFGDNQGAVQPVSPRPAPQTAIDRPVPPAPISSAPLAPAAPVSAPPKATATSVPPAPQAPRPTYSLRSNPNATGGWSAEGGTPVTVAQGETVETIAQRYGVPADALLSVNGYSSQTQVQPGARLTIPVYRANAARVAAAPPVPVPHPAKLGQARQRLASRSLVGEEIQGDKQPAPAKAAPKAQAAAPVPAKPQAVASPPAKPPAASPAPVKAEIAAKEKAERAKLAQAKAEKERAEKEKAKLAKAEEAKKAAEAKSARLTAAQAGKQAAEKQTAEKQIAAKPLPEKTAMVQPAQAKPAAASASAPPKLAPIQGAAAPAPAALTKPEPAKAKAEAEPATTVVAAPAASAASDAANPEFRWPARGRVIQGFGNAGNDGINIAVPEGTQVKAAESGVVAYAGSELKGYGNLVLIRHPNGFVTAYANNGSLNVKRGDTVKRGQTIALSGQSGNVSSPQLHFELRKGSKPVDPSTYLAGL